MSDFEMKLKLGDAVLELRGEKADVEEMYDKVKGSLMYTVSEGARVSEVPTQIISNPTVLLEEPPENQQITIKQLKLKLSGLSEKDWLLIYAYFFTDAGSKAVSVEEFKTYYLDERNSSSARSNFSNSLKASVDFINFIDDDNFTLNQKGKDRVLGLADGSITAKTKKNSESKKSSKTSSKIKFNKIQLNLTNEDEFIENFNQLGLRGPADQIHVLLKMFKDKTGMEEFSLDTVHSLFDLVSLDTPTNLSTMMSNYVNRDKTLEKTEEGNFKFKYKGEKKATSVISKGQ